MQYIQKYVYRQKVYATPVNFVCIFFFFADTNTDEEQNAFVCRDKRPWWKIYDIFVAPLGLLEQKIISYLQCICRAQE